MQILRLFARACSPRPRLVLPRRHCPGGTWAGMQTNQEASRPMLCINGIRQPDAIGTPASGAGLLQAYPSGVYTAFLLTHQAPDLGPYLDDEFKEERDLDVHVKRLAEGWTELQEASGKQAIKSVDPKDMLTLLHRVIEYFQAPMLAAHRKNRNAPSYVAQMVTVLVAELPASRSGYDMIVLLAPMPDKQLPPLHIACLAPGRQLPHIKHSQWVKDRSQYLPLLPPGASDGVCCSPDGRLLETFISNLFIIQQQPDGQPVVRTAGEGILPGIMRSQVLQVCAELQLPCQLQAPLCTERSQWREAFVTNAVRGIRPVDNIHCMHNKDLSLTPWQLRMPDGAPGAITLLIMNRLEERRLAKVETMTLLWRKLRAQGKVD